MNQKDFRTTLLLALFLFLVSAPQPDSRTVAEMTHNFIVPTQANNLQAAEAAAPAKTPANGAADTRQAGQDTAH